MSIMIPPTYYTAKFYLIYFDVDETVSTDKQLIVGDQCHIKEWRKLIEGRVVTHG